MAGLIIRVANYNSNYRDKRELEFDLGKTNFSFANNPEQEEDIEYTLPENYTSTTIVVKNLTISEKYSLKKKRAGGAFFQGPRY